MRTLSLILMLALPAAAQRLIQVTSNAVAQNSTAISADGRTVAYAEGGQLWAVNSDGTNPRLLVASGAGGQLSLTEDGSRVCFLMGGNAWLARTDGSGTSPVTTVGGVGRPMISADGSKIVFEKTDTSDREIWSVNTDGSGLLQLTFNTVQDVSPGVSGDGLLVAFATTATGPQNIWTIRTDGTNQSQLTSFTSGVNVFPRLDRFGLRASLESSSMGSYDIYSSFVPGALPTRLTTTPSAERFSSLSLDGEKITFHSDATGTREIWVVNFDGTGLRRLTSLGDPNVISTENYYPVANGDGSMVAFLSRTANGGMNPEGDEEVFVFRDALTRTSPARVGQQCQLLCDVPTDAGFAYQVAASFSTQPGIPLPGGRTLFLNLDAMMLLSLTTPSIFGNFAGGLDANGQAQPWINLPPVPPLAGLVFYVAFVTYTPGQGIVTVSNTIAILVTP